MGQLVEMERLCTNQSFHPPLPMTIRVFESTAYNSQLIYVAHMIALLKINTHNL
jgi:hypothetical protein